VNEENGVIVNDTTKLDTQARDANLTIEGVKVHWVRNDRPWDPRQINRKTRIHVTTMAEFDLLENLANRTRRPYEAWRPRVLAVLKALGYEGVRIRWSQHAGCSCPCSPGFIVEDGHRAGLRGGDLFMTLTDAPSVDETKPARICFATEATDAYPTKNGENS
jgi:hypothetical protein